LGKLIQLFLGASIVLLVYQIGKKLFNPTVALMAALLQTFSGISIFYEELLVPTCLISFLFLSSTLFLLRAIERQKTLEWGIAGVLLALTTLAQAGILLFLPFFFIWLATSFSIPFRKRVVAFILVFLCVLTALFSTFLRNLWVAHDGIFLTSHGGINFYIGNHPGSSGRFQSLLSKHTSSEQLLEQSKTIAEEETGRPLLASEVSRFWFWKGLEFIRKEPAEFLKLLFKKLLLFWNGTEIADVEDYYFFRSRFSALKFLGIPFGWMAPFGLLGLVVGFRNFKKLFLLYGFLFSQILGILLVFVNSRYRAPLVPFVVLFAAFGVSWLFDLFQRKRYRTIVLSFFCLLHLFLLVHVDIGSTNEELQHYNVGVALDAAGEHDAAIQELEKALFLSPEDANVLFALGNAHFRKTDYGKARESYRELLAHDPHHADTYFNLGLIAFYEDRLEEAGVYFEKSASLKPDLPDVHYLLGVVYRKKGLFQKAEEAQKRAIALGADPEAIQKDPEKPSVR